MTVRVRDATAARRAICTSLAVVAVFPCSAMITRAAAKPPPKDSFRGTITSATGALAGDSGKVAIYLHPARSSQSTRHLKVRLVGVRRHGVPRCVKLDGKLTGTITAQPTMPDTGRRFTIGAAGAVKPLGHGSATGTVVGTGFIAHGRESMRLTLATAHGGVTIAAYSGQVPGFTSP